MAISTPPIATGLWHVAQQRESQRRRARLEGCGSSHLLHQRTNFSCAWRRTKLANLAVDYSRWVVSWMAHLLTARGRPKDGVLVVTSVGQTKTNLNYEQASHGLWGWAGLKMPINAHVFQQAIFTREVGQSDLVFSVWWGFISGSVCAR